MLVRPLVHIICIALSLALGSSLTRKHLQTVWPDWMIFDSSSCTILFAKMDLIFGNFLAVWQNVTFQSKVLRLFFGQLWIKLGYFLFQHLVTLPPNSFSLCLQSTQIRTHSFHYSLNLSVCPTHFSYSQLIHIVSQSQPHTLCQYSTLMPHSHPSHTHTLTNPLSPTLPLSLFSQRHSQS